VEPILWQSLSGQGFGRALLADIIVATVVRGEKEKEKGKG
jgi:hypothetical protein